MTLTGIKTGLFGYNKKNVCQYVSDLNTVHDSEIKAIEEKLTQQVDELSKTNTSLASENAEFKATTDALNNEIAELKSIIEKLEAEKNDLAVSYAELESEVADLRGKSDIISAAIINAEKCAGTLIDDATNRANDMISDAENKVSVEVQRLDKAKQYIREIKSSVSLAMKNIENALGGIETDIDYKKTDIEDGETKKISVKEKFELFEKNLFRRA